MKKNRKNDKVSLTAIQEINLSSCLIGHKQMEELSEGLFRNRSIRTLHLDDNELNALAMRALALAVKQNPIIKIVTLQETRIDALDVIAFMEKLGDECFLDVFDCRKNPTIDVNNPALVQARKRYNKYKVLT